MNLLDAGTEFISQARLAAELPEGDFNTAEPRVRYIVDNGPFTLYSALNESQVLRMDGIFSQLELVRWINLVLMVTAIALLLTISLAIIIPITRRVESANDYIFNVFLHVPTPVIKNLGSQAHQRLNAATRQVSIKCL